MPEVLAQTLQITAFVAVMMIAVDYLNILTRGVTPRALAASRWRQYLVGTLLGASPGCLGSFAMVALYTHRKVSFGALVACMIATSGDESFVMLAMFPGRALLLMLGLALVGVASGAAADLLLKPSFSGPAFHDLSLHEPEACECFPRGRILLQLRPPSLARGVLGLGLAAFVQALVAGWIGPPDWGWIRWTLLGTGAFGLFIVLTVPEHFLEEHLWRHTVLQHVPRIFAWTLGALTVIAAIRHVAPAAALEEGGRWVALAAAALLGIVPESGPHLLFVTLYEQGLVPVSVLVASSIVQDGHGMLPLLAHSRRDFVRVKAVNLIAGTSVGAVMMALGW
jgi:hypothetical protein